jgi:hypothetical protein
MVFHFKRLAREMMVRLILTKIRIGSTAIIGRSRIWVREAY